MKVEKENILLDDEIVALDDVALIKVVKREFDSATPEYCLNIGLINGEDILIDVLGDKNKVIQFSRLRKLGWEIIRNGNKNFADLGFAIVNMDYVNNVGYDSNCEMVFIKYDESERVDGFKANLEQAKRVLAKVDYEYFRYEEFTGKQY